MSGLFEATPAEKRERDAVTFSEWGQSLTESQYFEREQVLRAQRWAAREMCTWLWKDASGRVLSSCETFRSDATLDGAPGSVWAVASVFTEPHLRGKGHGTALMNGLLERLRREPHALASILFSDVGAPLYERSGYRAFEAPDVVLPAREGSDDAQVEWRDVWPCAPLPDASGLSVLPTLESLDWHQERSRFYAKCHGRTLPRAQFLVKGDAWLSVQAYFRSDELLVLWREGFDPALLSAAQHEAHRLGLKQVRAWDCPQWPASLPRLTRDGELPMAVSLCKTPVSRWPHVQRALWV